MSSLTGLGRVGLWVVDIDNEGDAGHGYAWSVTIRHPVCYVQAALKSLDLLQEMMEHLTRVESVNQFFRLGATNEVELLVGIVDGRMLLRMGRNRDLTTAAFPWLLECAVDADQARSLVKALEEALHEAQSP
jgi:hypothetical protein